MRIDWEFYLYAVNPSVVSEGGGHSPPLPFPSRGGRCLAAGRWVATMPGARLPLKDTPSGGQSRQKWTVFEEEPLSNHLRCLKIKVFVELGSEVGHLRLAVPSRLGY